MSFALSAYSLDNFSQGNKDLKVEIKKVENGFLVELSGSKRVEYEDSEGKTRYTWDYISTQFVYNKLTEAISEVEDFFKLLEKWAEENKEEE